MEWARAICYSGYREGQSPKTGTYPTYEQIKEDINILYNMGFKYIRMYDPIVYSEMTCQVIRDMKYDMQMMLGPDLISEVNNPNCPWLKTNYSDEELNQVHYLGGYSELVPLNQKFGVVFNVAAFEQGEERILYYYYPDGSKHEVGRLIFDVLNNKEDQGIFI